MRPPEYAVAAAVASAVKLNTPAVVMDDVPQKLGVVSLKDDAVILVQPFLIDLHPTELAEPSARIRPTK